MTPENKPKILPKILLVEDEPHLAFNLQFNFEAEGYEVTHAATGTRALEIFLKEGPFHVIVLDVMLPEKNGIEVAQTIRKEDPKTAIIMLTALAANQDRIAGLETGVDDYLTKPFDLKELLLRVKRMIERSNFKDTKVDASDLQAIYDIGSFKFIPGELKLQNNDQAFELTRLESQMLLEFVTHPDQLLSRQYLLEKVWGVRSSVETRTVDNFVMRLRKILEPSISSPKYITSVRSMGYKFHSHRNHQP